MGAKNPRIDAYIANASPFARPILEHLRGLIHRACPEVQETIKWSMPHFEYHGILCGMAAFKEHCALNFWKGEMIAQKLDKPATKAMGQFGRLSSLTDLPADKLLLDCIKEAARLNEEGVKTPSRSKPVEKQQVIVPDYFLGALNKNKAARATFERFRNSHRKEYVQWITEAKTEQTRQRRIQTALEWLAEGKSRNWKYEK